MTQHLKQVLQRRRPRNYNLASNQIGGQCWQSFVLATGEAILDRYVLTLNVSRLPLAPVGTGRRGNSSAPHVSLLSHPITGIAACCARAATGHAAAPPTSATNSRRPMPTV